VGLGESYKNACASTCYSFLGRNGEYKLPIAYLSFFFKSVKKLLKQYVFVAEMIEIHNLKFQNNFSSNPPFDK